MIWHGIVLTMHTPDARWRLTQDSCASMMLMGFAIYKRTDNVSESEPHMTPDYWASPNFTKHDPRNSFKRGHLYEVPLHNNDREYATVSTGLVKIQQDRLNEGFANFYHDQNWDDDSLPPMSWPDHINTVAVNGCPLSISAHRTYFIGEVGEYFLQTTTAAFGHTCNNFNVKMTCSGGAETAAPADSDPLGFSVDVNTGAIMGTPEKVRDGYRMRLRAVDAADERSTVAEWKFDVREPPVFDLRRTANWSTAMDGKLAPKYHIAETHLLSKPRLKTNELLENPAGGDFGKVVYLLSANPVGDNPNCTILDTEETQVISALTDVATGKGAINIQCEGNYTAKLVVRDGAGDEVELRSWRFEVLRRDTVVPEYGPGGRGCANGEAFDGVPMDRRFTCDCSATQFSGGNCDIEQDTKAATNGPNGQDCRGGLPIDVVPFDQVFTCDCNATKFSGDNCNVPDAARSSSEQDDTTTYIIGAALAVLVLAAIVVFLVVRYQRHQRSLMATDFKAQLEQMKEDGLVDAEQISDDRVPRELKRSWLHFIDKLGEGTFGEGTVSI